MSVTPAARSKHTLLTVIPAVRCKHTLSTVTSAVWSKHTMLTVKPAVRSKHTLLTHSEHLALYFVKRLGRRLVDMFCGHLVSSTLSMTQINRNYVTEKLTSLTVTMTSKQSDCDVELERRYKHAPQLKYSRLRYYA